MYQVKTSGGDQFHRLAAKLLAAEREFTPEMGKALADGARPLPEEARLSALEHLPKRGGLNVLVAGSSFRLRRVSVGVIEIRVVGIRQLARTNEGWISHPTFGHRPKDTQFMPRAKGWFSDPMHRGKNRISDALGRAMHKIAQRTT